MRTRIIGTLAIAALAITACGGDDDGGSGSPQDELADMMIDEINASMGEEGTEGVSIDEDCVRDSVGQLSDDDANAILADPDGNPDVSVEAESIGEGLLECIDIDLGELDVDG